MQVESARIVFAGTPDFAVPVLQRLIGLGPDIVAVYTQPDRPSGRGRRPTASPVKILAQERGLALRQPASLRAADAVTELEALRPDVMVVAAYGQILPAAVLAAPRFGCLNVHASLLPRWRGAAPVARAVEAGDETTGVTIMLMDEGLDTGGIVESAEIDVDPDDTAGSLLVKLAGLGADVLARCLPRFLSGELEPVPQDGRRASYAPKLDKGEAPVDWARDAVDIRNKIRALNPWPVAQTRHKGNRIRILTAEMVPDAGAGGSAPGTVCAVDKRGVVVACGRGALRLTRMQRDHGRPLPAQDFLNGYTVAKGDRLAGRDEA